MAKAIKHLRWMTAGIIITTAADVAAYVAKYGWA